MFDDDISNESPNYDAKGNAYLNGPSLCSFYRLISIYMMSHNICYHVVVPFQIDDSSCLRYRIYLSDNKRLFLIDIHELLRKQIIIVFANYKEI